MITNKPGKQNIRKINTGQRMYKPYGYGQAVPPGPPPDPPLFDGVIADIAGEVNKVLTPIDVSGNFDTGGPVSNYSILFGPSWLNISNGGIMSGTPDEAGTTVGVEVRGSNAGGSADSNPFDTVVAPEAPVFDGTIADIVGNVGTPITPVDVSGNYDTGGAVATYTLQNEPLWMSISAAGVITGTPDVEAVTINITVVGSNATGGAPSNPFQCDIQAAGLQAPLFDGTIANITGDVGIAITPVDVSGNFDTGGAVSTYTLQNAPTWMSIDNNGLITGLPDAEAVTAGITVTGANGTPPDAVSNAFQCDIQAATNRYILTWDGIDGSATIDPITLPSTQSWSIAFTCRMDNFSEQNTVVGRAVDNTARFGSANGSGKLFFVADDGQYTEGTVIIFTTDERDIELRYIHDWVPDPRFEIIVNGFLQYAVERAAGISFTGMDVVAVFTSTLNYTPMVLKDLHFTRDDGFDVFFAIDSNSTVSEESKTQSNTMVFNNIVAGDWSLEPLARVFFVSLPLFPLEAVTYLGEIVTYV